MAIKFIKFDEKDEKLKKTLPEKGINPDFLIQLLKLKESGYSFEYEAKIKITPSKGTKEEEKRYVSKELLLRRLKNKSGIISESIKEIFELSEEKINNIDGFLSEYANTNETSLDALKSVRTKFE